MAQMHTCALCGWEFDTENMACHTACPLSTGCSIICCPNCGYQIPDQNQSVLASALKRQWERFRQAHRPGAPQNADEPQPLTRLRAGQQAEVTEIASTTDSRLAHLSAYGLVPGSLVTLRQRVPAYVLAVDETEVALDAEVAREILVRVR